jgi:acyl-CoA thioesterase-1
VTGERDVRVCTFGDSYVQGVGDPAGGGWVRLLEQECAHQTTVYNLGVRRDTSLDVERRWWAEARARLRDGDGYGVLFSFGVNDTQLHRGRPRVPRPRCVAVLGAMLDAAHAAGWRALVVGPPVPADSEHVRRTTQLSDALGDTCAERGVTFVDLAHRLIADPVWHAEVAAGDGAHPGPAGYRLLADLIRPAFTAWIGEIAERP